VRELADFNKYYYSDGGIRTAVVPCSFDSAGLVESVTKVEVEAMAARWGDDSEDDELIKC